MHKTFEPDARPHPNRTTEFTTGGPVQSETTWKSSSFYSSEGSEDVKSNFEQGSRVERDREEPTQSVEATETYDLSSATLLLESRHGGLVQIVIPSGSLEVSSKYWVKKGRGYAVKTFTLQPYPDSCGFHFGLKNEIREVEDDSFESASSGIPEATTDFTIERLRHAEDEFSISLKEL